MISNDISPMGTDGDRLEQAFPIADHGELLANGLTKRELFAVLAMQGLLAGRGEDYPEKLAVAAVAHTDALIEVLAS